MDAVKHPYGGYTLYVLGCCHRHWRDRVSQVLFRFLCFFVYFAGLDDLVRGM